VANKDSQDGVISGIKDIQSGYAKAFKAAGSNIVNGSKAAGGKVASGARSSGQFFLKGAQAIGHGFKVTGDKVKDSAGSVGSKMAVKPKKSADTPLKAKSKAVPENDLVANESEKVLDDSSAPGKPLAPLSTKPMVKAKTTTDGENKSLMGKTFGRLNPFARSKPQSPATTMQPSAQPQAVSDLRQAYPN
jgi:hypothetical protein